MRLIAAVLMAGVLTTVAAAALLEVALRLVGLTSGPLTARLATLVLDFSPWLFASGVFWLSAPLIASAAGSDHALAFVTPIDEATAYSVVGVGLISASLIWLLASVIARVAGIAAFGSWAVDGRVFLEDAFFTDLLLTHAPWVMSGVGLRTVSRHL